ncbi:MAG: preprotein translocase subunit YajC [Gulosibacter sp.]|uniref:preprotein translocase subunit YajC n=1 Tax=Gulosibacter sp. TaxID=2817531 RepID=UPI003F9076DF
MELSLLLPLGLLVLMMVFMWRSNKKRTAQQQELRSKIQPGAEVMTQAGIYGTLVSVDEAANVATLETSPGTVLRVHSATIAHVVEPTVDVPDDASALTGDTVDEDDRVTSADDAVVEDASANDPADTELNDEGDNSNDDRPKA